MNGGIRLAGVSYLKQIITIQHTESLHHVNGMVGSWTDWELTEYGKEQADRIGRRLGDELKDDIKKKKTAFYSSDLMRAKQTAEGLARYIGIEPVLKRELRERNLGRCCGKSREWLFNNVDCWENTIDDRMFSDGESVRDEWNRLKPFFDEMMSGDSELIFIASHSEMLGVFNVMFLGLEPEALNSFDIRGAAGGVSKLLVWDNGKRTIKCVSDMSYVR